MASAIDAELVALAGGTSFAHARTARAVRAVDVYAAVITTINGVAETTHHGIGLEGGATRTCRGAIECLGVLAHD